MRAALGRDEETQRKLPLVARHVVEPERCCALYHGSDRLEGRQQGARTERRRRVGRVGQLGGRESR